MERLIDFVDLSQTKSVYTLAYTLRFVESCFIAVSNKTTMSVDVTSLFMNVLLIGKTD